jgi:serine/threonine protein kinase
MPPPSPLLMPLLSPPHGFGDSSSGSIALHSPALLVSRAGDHRRPMPASHCCAPTCPRGNSDNTTSGPSSWTTALNSAFDDLEAIADRGNSGPDALLFALDVDRGYDEQDACGEQGDDESPAYFGLQKDVAQSCIVNARDTLQLDDGFGDAVFGSANVAVVGFTPADIPVSIASNALSCAASLGADEVAELGAAADDAAVASAAAGAGPAWKLRVVKSIGRGSFGAAWLVEVVDAPSWYIVDQPAKQTIVVKLVDSDRTRLCASQVNKAIISLSPGSAAAEVAAGRRASHCETGIMRQLHHPNLMGCVDFGVEAENMTAILMSHCDAGDLSDLITSIRHDSHARCADRSVSASVGSLSTELAPLPVVDEARVWSIATQLLVALDHLHTEIRVVHRDFKPRNIFLRSTGEVVVGDFGIACRLPPNSLVHPSTPFCGSPNYAAPEIYQQEPFDGRADVWSLGCVVYELLTHGERAFSGNSLEKLGEAISNGRFRHLHDSAAARQYSETLCDFVMSMLSVDVDRRPDATALLAHPRIIELLAADDQAWPTVALAATPQWQQRKTSARAALQARSVDEIKAVPLSHRTAVDTAMIPIVCVN